MEIKYSKTFIKSLSNLDKRYRQNILTSIEGLIKIPPEGDIKPLKGYNNTNRLRVGKYRILFRIIDDTLFIDSLGSRGNIYK